MSHYLVFFFNDTATTEIYTLSLHDALPIGPVRVRFRLRATRRRPGCLSLRSEEHASELQSLAYLVCRLLLEKKKKQDNQTQQPTKKKRKKNKQKRKKKT